MLSSTYTLVALSCEQQNVKYMLLRLENSFQSKDWEEAKVTNNFQYLKAAFFNLRQLDQYCHARKLECFVIPAIRRATREVDALLEQLESLSSACVSVLRLASEQLESILNRDFFKLNDLRFSMEIYCQNIMKKLALEEENLFPVVRGLLSTEEWFSIANKILLHNKNSDREQTAASSRRVNRRKRPARIGLPFAEIID